MVEAVAGPESVEQIEAQLPPPTSGEQAEAEYQAFIEKNLPRNFAGHFMHGMLGMTGFRIFNSPTFLPAYIHLITAHMPFSDAWVGVGQALQSAGAVLSPVVGAAQVEHRKKVLPVSMWMGTAMRVQVGGDRHLRLGAARAGAGRLDHVLPAAAGPLPGRAGRRLPDAAGQGDPDPPARAAAGAAQRGRRPDLGRASPTSPGAT